MELPAQSYRIPLKLHVRLQETCCRYFPFLLPLVTLSSQFWTEQNFLAVPGGILSGEMITKDLSAVFPCLPNWWWQTEEISEADEDPVSLNMKIFQCSLSFAVCVKEHKLHLLSEKNYPSCNFTVSSLREEFYFFSVNFSTLYLWHEYTLKLHLKLWIRMQKMIIFLGDV